MQNVFLLILYPLIISLPPNNNRSSSAVAFICSSRIFYCVCVAFWFYRFVQVSSFLAPIFRICFYLYQLRETACRVLISGLRNKRRMINFPRLILQDNFVNVSRLSQLIINVYIYMIIYYETYSEKKRVKT